MNNKFLTFLVILVILSSNINAQSILRLRPANKLFVSHQLNDIRKLSFETTDNITVVKMNGTLINYNLANYSYVDFNNTITDVSDISYDICKLSLFPNPVSSVLNIKFNSYEIEKCNILIYNYLGEIIIQENALIVNKIATLNVDLLPKGIYLCKVSIGKQVEVLKFIKNNF